MQQKVGGTRAFQATHEASLNDQILSSMIVLEALCHPLQGSQVCVH